MTRRPGWCHEVSPSVRSPPLVVAVGRAGVSPASEGLGAVVSAAQAGEVCWTGLAGWSVGVVRGDVVQVAAAGVAGAAGEDATAVADHHQVPHPGGRVVLVDP